MQDLSRHLEGLKLQLQESKGREAQAQERVHKLQEDLSAEDEELLERTSSLQRLESQLREQRVALDQGRSREQELIQEMHEVQFNSLCLLFPVGFSELCALVYHCLLSPLHITLCLYSDGRL